MNWLTIVCRIWFVVMSSCVLFYIFVVYKPSKLRNTSPFDSSYFQIWRHLGYVDCVTALLLWTFVKSDIIFEPRQPFISAQTNMLTLVMGAVLTIALASTEYIICVLMACNRLTSAILPFQHKKVRIENGSYSFYYKCRFGRWKTHGTYLYVVGWYQQ